MRAGLLRQPLAGSPSVQSFLRELAMDESVMEIDIVVAWARQSGVSLAWKELQKFTKRGGFLRIISGISQGGATAQGLQMTHDIASEAYVYHQNSRTFHPKVYAGFGPEVARFYVGSANFTFGGLARNYELGIIQEADLLEPSDMAVVDELRAWVDDLVADNRACKLLTDDTLSLLTSDPRYRVMDEGKATSSQSGFDQGPSGSIFSDSNLEFRGASSASASSHGHSGGGDGSKTRMAPQVYEKVLRRWYKKLSPSEVSRKGGNTHPQGHMTLTQGPGIQGHKRHPIDSSRYFREEFFGDEKWAGRNKGSGEEARVSVTVVVGTAVLGEYELVVGNKRSYASGQGNRTSFLEWGPELNRYLRLEVDHTGEIATLEKLGGGAYTLTIASAEVGPFIY